MVLRIVLVYLQKSINTFISLHCSLYPIHLKMQDSAGIRNAFSQGIDCREWLFILKINNAA